MYGRSPLSLVVVCEPITLQLNTCPLPEHCRLNFVIAPFDFKGTFHERESDEELSETAVRLRGGDPGPTIERDVLTCTNCIQVYILTLFISDSTNHWCCRTITYYCCSTHSTGVASEGLYWYFYACYIPSFTGCCSTNIAGEIIANYDSIPL